MFDLVSPCLKMRLPRRGVGTFRPYVSFFFLEKGGREEEIPLFLCYYLGNK